VVLHLGGEGGLEPFIPIDASNVRFTPSLLLGSDEDISLSLLVDGDADGGTYSMEITLTYENVLGVRSSEQETIGLVVMTQPMLEVDLFEPVAKPLVVGEAFEIPIEVINVGRHLARVSTIELISESLDVAGGSLYLGQLDPGTSGALVAVAVADKAGTANATVWVHYLDDLNQPQKVMHELAFEIKPGIPPQENQTGPGDVLEQDFLQILGRVLLGLFGLGG
jgi:hypothetical protein